ncbi:unnamed protein product [Hymenolepis diminuta]|uniref:GPI ethanolamine phosphate transferase 2 C-terminal domain-containing protein n=2 Tax=Hymenolepis diminuta TaxID=6216 RepID=A0A564Z6Y9_HYMDI|nr:unnamed protein product [Hymenolepis diminuta]
MTGSISILIRYGFFILLLYFCITNLFSNSANIPTTYRSTGPSKNSKISNVVLMVVDALRADMISSKEFSDNWPNLHNIMKENMVQCFASSLTAPSVTSPRIKAIATGGVPEFIDILYNLDDSGLKKPSWVQLMAKHDRRLEIYGDNTWIRLFPGAFKRSDGTTSFFVNDFYEVDENVTRHLDNRLEACNDWDLMILHYLGLDHIGHVQGPHGDAMPSKIREMDLVLQKVVSGLKAKSKDWMIVLTGDHGMSDQGSHGGSSYPELTTTMLLISPKFKSQRDSACEIDGGVFRIRSDQTDIATTLGLLFGVGIPAGSIGVPPIQVIQTFWPEPLERYQVLLDLLEHLRSLMKCTDANCETEYLATDDLINLNALHTDIEVLVRICSADIPIPHPTCAQMSIDKEKVTSRVLNLVSAFQKRTLLHTNRRTNVNLVGFLCLFLGAIAVSFLAPGIMNIFNRKEHLTLKPGHRPRTLAYTLLAGFSVVCLFLHLLSLLSSSLIEEEHQTWYFLATTNLFALILILVLNVREGESTSSGIGNVFCVLCVLCLDRFLLKLLNQTGDKWINEPDLTDFLEAFPVVMWIALAFTWVAIVLTRALLASSHGIFFGLHFRTILSLSLVVLTQLIYRIAVHSSESNRVHSSAMWSSTLVPARLAYIALAVDFAVCLWYCKRRFAWSKDSSNPYILIGFDVSMWTLPSPVHCLALLSCLLGRPTSILLWGGVMVKEILLARVFHTEFGVLGASGSVARSKLTYFITVLYWMEGWVTFFQQGNANKFSTVDMASGYVGLSEHSHILSTLLVMIYTYSGPLFWFLSLHFRFFLLNCGSEIEARRLHVRNCLINFTLGFLTIGTTVSAVICLLMHSHLFIWSVFAPKLFFMAAYCCAIIPALIFVLMC